MLFDRLNGRNFGALRSKDAMIEELLELQDIVFSLAID